MQKPNLRSAGLIATLCALAAGCAKPPAVEPPTPAASSTSAATPTATPKPTATPRPTATSTPIPASKGDVVSAEKLEFVVLDVFLHDRIYTGDNYYHYANPGYTIIDVYARLNNPTSNPLSVLFTDLHLQDDAGRKSGPPFAGVRQAGASEKVDPFSIPTDIRTDERGAFDFPAAAYVRLYYIVKDKPEQVVLFGYRDSQLVELTVKK